MIGPVFSRGIICGKMIDIKTVFGGCMKITFIVPHFPPHVGGGEQLYLDVCKGLTSRGHKVRVVTSASGGVLGQKKYEGIDVWYCNWKLLFGHPIVKTEDIKEHVKWCDVVHTAIYSTALKSINASKKMGKPCAVTLHEVMGDKWSLFEPDPIKAAAFRFYEGLILKKAGNVHVVSESTKRDYLKFCRKPGRVFRIYNFLNLPDDSLIQEVDTSFRSVFSMKENERGILYFGRPAPNKGIFVLLEAIGLIKENLKGKDISFCLILSKDPAKGRQRAEELIKSYGISDYVKVKNSFPRNELLKILSGADLCVIPSITEGFGYSACESCHYRRPVISSDGGSLKEVVSGKALFFQNKNAKDLADKLLEYIEHGTENFEAIPDKIFKKEKIIDEYIKMYEQLLGSGKEA